MFDFSLHVCACKGDMYDCFVWEILMDVWKSAFPSSKTATDSTALYMLESGEMTEQTDWQTKQPSQVACVSGDLN